ncbi:MAG: DUF3089 domain-containing protein, partial [Bacteroidetes bacterium]|nr:DUF3089 domain-containing protein [Bacteroidota bacterium]
MMKLEQMTLLAIFTLSSLLQLSAQTSDGASNKFTDYSNRSNWSIISDTIVHEIDVFFVHPTTYGPPANGKYNANLNDSLLNKITDLYAINWMTSAFEENCNIFAPRYRQVNIEVLSMPKKEQDIYLEIPVGDIKSALHFYLENLNDGRPFILASHSQGSNVLQTILLENPKILKNPPSKKVDLKSPYKGPKLSRCCSSIRSCS